jgi:hypothetical protein
MLTRVYCMTEVICWSSMRTLPAFDTRGCPDEVSDVGAGLVCPGRGWGRSVVRMEFAGSSVYEGEWVAGRQEGEGKQVYGGGDWYEGRWRAGLPDGRGGTVTS